MNANFDSNICLIPYIHGGKIILSLGKSIISKIET